MFEKLTVKAVVVLSVCFFVFTSNGAFAAEPGGAAAQNILLISWDGTQRDHLMELLKAGKLPNLQAMIDASRLIPIEITDHKTDTKAGHTQILTGYAPETTGVYNNREYNAIPLGLSVFERIEEARGPENVETVLLTGKAGNIGSRDAGMRREGKRKKEATTTAKKRKRGEGKGARAKSQTKLDASLDGMSAPARQIGANGDKKTAEKKNKGKKELIMCPPEP